MKKIGLPLFIPVFSPAWGAFSTSPNRLLAINQDPAMVSCIPERNAGETNGPFNETGVQAVSTKTKFTTIGSSKEDHQKEKQEQTNTNQRKHVFLTKTELCSALKKPWFGQHQPKRMKTKNQTIQTQQQMFWYPRWSRAEYCYHRHLTQWGGENPAFRSVLA